MSQNLLSAAVVIGALSVNHGLRRYKEDTNKQIRYLPATLTLALKWPSETLSLHIVSISWTCV